MSFIQILARLPRGPFLFVYWDVPGDNPPGKITHCRLLASWQGKPWDFLRAVCADLESNQVRKQTKGPFGFVVVVLNEEPVTPIPHRLIFTGPLPLRCQT